MPIFTNFSTIGLIFNTTTATIRLFLKYLGSKKKVTTRGKMLINESRKDAKTLRKLSAFETLHENKSSF